MPTVSDIIPDLLQAEVKAALDWYNASQPDAFEVTGIVDAELSLATGAPRELRLVLCGGDTCQQQCFQVSRAAGGFEVALSETGAATNGEPPNLQSELDPPPGARNGWLDSVLQKHSFVLLVFYRGFW